MSPLIPASRRTLTGRCLLCFPGVSGVGRSYVKIDDVDERVGRRSRVVPSKAFEVALDSSTVRKAESSGS